MNSRERVLTALDHQEPDRVPFDLGSTLTTGISQITYRKLLPILGFDANREVGIVDTIQQLAAVDEDVLQKLQVDTRGVVHEALGGRAEMWEDEDNSYLKDQWHVTWRMPKRTGYYYDMTAHPLRGDNPADIDKFSWPNPRDPARWEGLVDQVKPLHDAGEYCVVLGSTGMSVGLLQTIQWLQGFEDSYTNLAGNPLFMHKLVDKITELDLEFWDAFLGEVGPYLDVILYADDFAGQNGPLMSIDMYKNYFKTGYKEIFDLIHRKAPNIHILFHSCGAVYDLIPELIELGIDILNPVQVSAVDMDTKRLKQEFGDAITFWGGGVDTQRILPFGTPQDVKDEVKRRIDDLAPGGGFVFNTVHNIQRDVPPENVMAMHEALLEYGAY